MISLFSIFTFQPVLSASDVIPIKKIGEVEEILYGKRSSLSIIDRITDIEKTLYNQKRDGSLVERAENIADYVLTEGSRPSLPFVLNSLEWTLSNEIRQGNIIDRLADLETDVFGKPESGPITDRIKNLANMSFPGGKISGSKIVLSADTEIPLKLTEKIDSATVQKGELIPFEIADNIMVDGKLVVPEGTKGKMKVTGVEKSGQFGRDGEVMVEFLSLRAIDGRLIDLTMPESEFMEKRSRQLAVAAGVLGAVVIGNPLGLGLSYFVKGSPEVYSAGTKIIAKTADQYTIFALQLN